MSQVNTTNGDYVISDVQFCYPLVSADADTFASLHSGIDAYNIDYSPLFSHSISVLAGSVAETHIVPARYSSVNSVTLIMRRNDDATAQEQMKYAHRCAARLESIQYKIGGSSYPYQPLTRTAGADGGANQLARVSSEMYLESMSAYKTINSGFYKQAGNAFLIRYASRSANDGDMRAISGAYEFEGVAQSQAITSDVSISSDTAEQVGSFFVCVPMAAYKSPEIHRAIYSGVNTVGGDVYCELQFGTGGVPANMVFDYYTHYSALLRMGIPEDGGGCRGVGVLAVREEGGAGRLPRVRAPGFGGAERLRRRGRHQLVHGAGQNLAAEAPRGGDRCEPRLVAPAPGEREREPPASGEVRERRHEDVRGWIEAPGGRSGWAHARGSGNQLGYARKAAHWPLEFRVLLRRVRRRLQGPQLQFR